MTILADWVVGVEFSGETFVGFGAVVEHVSLSPVVVVVVRSVVSGLKNDFEIVPVGV